MLLVLDNLDTATFLVSIRVGLISPGFASLLEQYVCAGKAHMLLLLRMRTMYLRKLPWLLAGLAHPQEDVARRIAAEVLHEWQADPRPEAHHRISAMLLQPGQFMTSLQTFAEGASLCNLPLEFRERVASWRFIPVVETTIEEKHARVSLNRKKHHIGPVRVSLSNRLPLLDRWVRRGHVCPKKLVSAFTSCRSLMTVPSQLNVSDHPSLDGMFSKSPASMRVVLPKVLYRCSLPDMYHSFDAMGKAHDKSKRKRAETQARLVEKDSRALSFDKMLFSAMQQHMLTKHEESEGTCFHTVPRSCLALQTVEAALNEPQTKQRRVSQDAVQDAPVAPDVDLHQEIAPAQSVTFQILMKNPGDKKVIRPAVGAGGKLSKGAVVLLHKSLCDSEPTTAASILVSGSAATTEDLGGHFC